MRFSLLTAILPLAMASPTGKAPFIKRDGETVPGRYIVMLKKAGGVMSAAARAKEITKSVVADADHVYQHIGGLALALTDKEVEKLRLNPHVAYIEQDSRGSIFATQRNATWGLARISNTKPGSTTYTYDDSAGAGTCAYVLDTGIDVTHPDFEGRATFVASFDNGITVDDHGHGTHCAGTIGSKTYGVAKKTRLYAIKTFDKNGSGSDSVMVASMDKVIEDAKTRDCPNGVVVSMSFGTTRSQAVNDAAKSLITAGFFAAVAGGNGNFFGFPEDVSTQSPASEPSVCTVGATGSNDKVASFSNYGKLLDIYGPGLDIVSLKPGNGTDEMSGTSMAAPHVAGLGAYFLGTGKPAEGLCEYLQSVALKDGISGVPRGTRNLFIQNDRSTTA